MEFYYMHRSDAIAVLLSVMKHPELESNLELAYLLETNFPEKQRNYIVKEDHLELDGYIINKENF